MTFAECLDLARTISSFATPLGVVGLGFLLNHRLKNIENAQWHNRTIIAKRLDLYDKIAPDLNAIYCFFRFCGNWKDLSPEAILEAKRRLDKSVHIYRYLLSQKFFDAYEDFIGLCFETNTGKGKDALIKSEIDSYWGNRREHRNYEWEDRFEKNFDTRSTPEVSAFDQPYLKVMSEFKDCIGIKFE